MIILPLSFNNNEFSLNYSIKNHLWNVNKLSNIKINLEPLYQRKIVWNNEKKILLIDTNLIKI